MKRPQLVAGTTLAIVVLGWLIWWAATWDPPPPPAPDGYFYPPVATINFGDGDGAAEAISSLLKFFIGLAALSLLASLVAMALRDPATARVCSMPPLLVGAGLLALALMDAAEGNHYLPVLFTFVAVALLCAGYGLRRWAEAGLSHEQQIAFAQAREARAHPETSREPEATGIDTHRSRI